jgi:hypothetical protein
VEVHIDRAAGVRWRGPTCGRDAWLIEIIPLDFNETACALIYCGLSFFRILSAFRLTPILGLCRRASS